MVAWFGLVGCALYSIPVWVVMVARSRRRRDLGDLALDIPLAVAADLIGTLLLARLMLLPHAVVASRVLWVLGGAGYVAWRIRRDDAPAWPSAVGWRELGMAGLSAYAGVYLSMQFSHPCQNQDRYWHIPLVGSLEGQRLPFENVYLPKTGLAYHYTGDVVGAALQTLSLGHIHASYALTLAHEVFFAFTAVLIALMLRWAGLRSIALAAAGALGVLLTGPFVLFRTKGQPDGYNFINYLRVSYRPHTVIAGFLIIGFVAAVFLRLRESDSPPAGWRTALVLLAAVGVLAITDEASVGVLGAALGAAWLVVPDAVHPKRWRGFAVLLLLAAALVLANVVFSGALAPGAPHHTIKLIAPRSPGYRNHTQALALARGRKMLLYDIAPQLLALAAGIGLWFTRRRRLPLAGPIFLFAAVVVSTFALTCLNVDGKAMESHRFMTAAMLLAPFMGALWLAETGAASHPLVSLLVIAAIASPAASTIEWLRVVAPKRYCALPKTFDTSEDFYETDCRLEVGTGRQIAVATYVERRVFYLYTGCQPVLAAAPKPHWWKIHVGGPIYNRAALEQIDRTIGAGATLTAICSTRGNTGDIVCDFARRHRRCRQQAEKILSCSLSSSDRRAILAK
jgi:hypothetical protein